MAQRKFWGPWVLEEGTCGKWRDRLLMMRIEMQHLIHLNRS